MYIKRKIEYQIQASLKSKEIIAIIGPRQCGKTTLLRHLADELNEVNFISFDDLKALQMFDQNIDDFIATYVRGKKYLFIDEFQYAKEGGKKLKYIYDSNEIKMFISGSSAVDLTIHAVKYLVGRVFVFNLYQFDFEEFLQVRRPEFISSLKEQKESLTFGEVRKISNVLHKEFMDLYEEYAVYGGYPKVVIENDKSEKVNILKAIFSTYFLREVRDILGLIDDYKMNKLVQSLALQVGNLIDYHSLQTASEFLYRPLKGYLNFLEKTFICSFIRPYFMNKTLEIVKNPKVFFFDTGMRNIIIDDFRGFASRPDSGALLENTVFQELIKSGKNVKYWRTKQKQEVDFIIEGKNRTLSAIEVKMDHDSSEMNGLNLFAIKYPEARKVMLYFKRKENFKDSDRFIKYSVYSV
ncbi:MAG: ATP-binding protein [Candidatus Taylorbacteria bacterium]|nr:ATP-binding protein [Candidatus Taylorbacteria bacterium]